MRRVELAPGHRWAECLCKEIDVADRPCMVCLARHRLNPAICTVGGCDTPATASWTDGNHSIARCRAHVGRSRLAMLVLAFRHRRAAPALKACRGRVADAEG